MREETALTAGDGGASPNDGGAPSDGATTLADAPADAALLSDASPPVVNCGAPNSVCFDFADAAAPPAVVHANGGCELAFALDAGVMRVRTTAFDASSGTKCNANLSVRFTGSEVACTLDLTTTQVAASDTDIVIVRDNSTKATSGLGASSGSGFQLFEQTASGGASTSSGTGPAIEGGKTYRVAFHWKRAAGSVSATAMIEAQPLTYDLPAAAASKLTGADTLTFGPIDSVGGGWDFSLDNIRCSMK